MNWFAVAGVVGLPSIIGGGLCMIKSLIESLCCVCTHTDGFNVFTKDASHAKGCTVHCYIEHDLFNSAVTFQNVCVVPGDLLLKQKVPLWNVQKITKMMLVRHFENEKTFSLNGKIQLGRDGLSLIASNAH